MPDVGRFVAEWNQEQIRRANQVRIEPLEEIPRYIAGADCAFSADHETIFAAVVVYDRQAKHVVDVATDRRPVTVPYIPGYLSFREGPSIIDAVRRLKHPFGVLCLAGQGIAHPRRCGIATHVGVELDVPAVGIARNILCGQYEPPPTEAGSTSPIEYYGDTIGVALRTQTGVNPVFVSPGHRVDLPSSIAITMACTAGYRVPEPIRHAAREVACLKQPDPIGTLFGP